MTLNVIALSGDGIGPEVMQAALDVLEVVQDITAVPLEIERFRCGAEHYRDHGQSWQNGAKEACETADAILLGAVGHPTIRRPDGTSPASEVIIHLRNGLDLFANLRPVRPFQNVHPLVCDQSTDAWSKNAIDFMIVRENTEGLYCRQATVHGKGNSERVIDERIISRRGSERIIDFAFRYAQTIGRESVTCVDKSNVLQGCRFFREVFREKAIAYPSVNTSFRYVDAFMLQTLRSPESIDVAVMGNLFGDIVSDGAAVILGGMGMAPSANIGIGKGMFEPVHGSAPDIAGSGKANPTAMIRSTQMMMEWFAAPWHTGDKDISDPDKERCEQAAALIETGLGEALRNGLHHHGSLPCELGGKASCSAFSKTVISTIKDLSDNTGSTFK